MKNNVKHILTSIGIISAAAISFILFIPVFLFVIILLIITILIYNKKIIKANTNFFKKNNHQRGRIIDQDVKSSNKL